MGFIPCLPDGLLYCFTDRTCARESTFFVDKLMARATNHIPIVLITNSIRICITYYLCVGICPES